jgi:hypothetical protein
MRTFDPTPLWRSTVGFDRLFDLIDSSLSMAGDDNYPPYNIERTGEDTYHVSLASPPAAYHRSFDRVVADREYPNGRAELSASARPLAETPGNESSRCGNGVCQTRSPAGARFRASAYSGDWGLEPSDQAVVPRGEHGTSSAEVTESPLANNVTRWPCFTSSSVKYETTRSVPPYIRGGTLSKRGAI